MEEWNHEIWKNFLAGNERFLVRNVRKQSVWNMEKSSFIPFHASTGQGPCQKIENISILENISLFSIFRHF